MATSIPILLDGVKWHVLRLNRFERLLINVDKKRLKLFPQILNKDNTTWRTNHNQSITLSRSETDSLYEFLCTRIG